MNTFEIDDGNHRYILTSKILIDDSILVEFRIDGNLWDCLKTYPWYFGVASFEELVNLDKDEILNIIERQFNEKYFYPMPYEQVKKYVKTLIKNTIKSIDEAIDHVKNKIPDFTSLIKNITSISSIFDGKVKLVLDEEHDKLSEYYSLITTDAGHMPVPIFMTYLEEGVRSDEDEISILKNVLYFIKGYEEKIPEERRDWESELVDDVRGAKSELFQKAVVLYNKLPKEKRYPVEDEDEHYEECPEPSLPDGIGYCRDFDYEELMKKTEDELANEIIESLTKIREKMLNLKEYYDG
jgi:hypothetical protein